MARWRQSFYKLVPSWLSSGDGEKVLYSLGAITDIFVEKARQSLTARFPSYSGPTGLRMLGEERGIPRGREESNVGFARRLQAWRGPRGHLVRGSAYAMLRQIWHYFDGIEVQEIDAGGNVFTVARDGTESATHGGTWEWDTLQVQTPVAALDSDPPTHDDNAADDGDDALNPGHVIVNPGTTGTIDIHCDGTPGRLIFIHVLSGLNSADLNTVTLPDGWTEIENNFVAAGGTGAPYQHWLFYMVVPATEYFTSVTVTCTANASGPVNGDRFIARAVNVPGVYDADPIVQLLTTDGNATAGNSFTVSTPLLDPYAIKTISLAFIGSKVTTHNPIVTDRGSFTEVGLERTAGATGVGLGEQYMINEFGTPDGTLTVGGSSALSIIMVTVRQRQPWYRFWLKLIPEDDQGITDWGTWAEDAARGTGTWADGVNETWGQTGVTPGDAQMVSNLFKGEHPWKMAGTKAEWLVLVLDQDTEHEPIGTWKHWLYNGLPERYSGWRYWKL